MEVSHVILVFVVLLGVILHCSFPEVCCSIIKEDFPKFLSKIIALSLVLITFIFGIHSETFSSYDKNIVDSQTQYDWFSPENIIEFPIEQFKIGVNGIYPKNIIDFKAGIIDTIDIPLRKTTILIDKTASISYKGSAEEIIKLKEVLIEKVDGSIDNFKEIAKPENLKVEDLYVLTALDKLTKEEFRKTTDIQLIIYKGSSVDDGIHLQMFRKKYNQYSDRERDDFIINSLKSLMKINTEENYIITKKRYTDFSELALELKKEKYLGKGFYVDGGLKRKYNHIGLFILSDFIHQQDFLKNSFKDVYRSWSDVNNLVSQVNLISFDASKKSREKKSNIDVREIFKENFNHLYYFQYDKNSIIGLREDLQINMMFSTVLDAKNIKKPLVLYHSWNEQDYRYDYKGDVQILKHNEKNNLILSFTERVRPTNYIKPYTFLTFQKKSKFLNSELSLNTLKVYEHQKEILRGSQESDYKVLFSIDEIESENFSLEFTYPNSSYTVRHPIIFKPVLSPTSSVYLIILYALLIISIIQGSFYFIVRIYIYKNQFKNRLKLLFYLLFTVIFFSSLHLGSVYISELWTIENSSIVNVVLWSSIVCLLFSSILNSKSLKNQSNSGVVESLKRVT